MKSRKLLFILGLGGYSLVAQNYVDIAKLYYNTSALNEFENSNAETRVSELGLDLAYPILLKSGDAVLTGMTAERTRVTLNDAWGYSDLTSLALRVGVNKKHSDKWSGSYILIPKLASDFNRSSSKDFQMGAVVLMRYTKNERKNYRVGLYYNSDLFGPFFVPLFGLYYLSPNNKFEANITLPVSADIHYKLNTTLHAGFNFTSQIRTFRLNEPTLATGAGYVRKASNEACLYLKVNFTKNISLQGRVGYTVGRSYRVYNEDDKVDVGLMSMAIGDSRTQLNTDFSNGMIYQAVLLYRFIRE
jgi:hypothetical protein